MSKTLNASQLGVVVERMEDSVECTSPKSGEGARATIRGDERTTGFNSQLQSDVNRDQIGGAEDGRSVGFDGVTSMARTGDPSVFSKSSRRYKVMQ